MNYKQFQFFWRFGFLLQFSRSSLEYFWSFENSFNLFFWLKMKMDALSTFSVLELFLKSTMKAFSAFKYSLLLFFSLLLSQHNCSKFHFLRRHKKRNCRLKDRVSYFHFWSIRFLRKYLKWELKKCHNCNLYFQCVPFPRGFKKKRSKTEKIENASNLFSFSIEKNNIR